MKFLVSDKQVARHDKIREYLTPEDGAIAIILAAIDLEWTIRRAIDAGTDDAATDTTDGKRVSGLTAYKKAWSKTFKGTAVPALNDIITDWDALEEAYQLRHDLVHGRVGTGSGSYLKARVECLLAASVAVAKHGAEHGFDPYRRLRKRRLTGPT